MFEAIVFDFDLTLADSRAAVIACARRALRELGEADVTDEAVVATIGISLIETHALLTGRRDPAGAAAYARAFLAAADEVMAGGANVELFDGVPDTIRQLRANGLRLAIASTKHQPRIRQILGRFDLAEAFDVIVGGDDVTHPKPAPDGLRAVLGQLALPSDRVLYVGDHEVDGKAARAAGVPFLAVLSGTCSAAQLEEWGPVTIVPSVNDLLPWPVTDRT